MRKLLYLLATLCLAACSLPQTLTTESAVPLAKPQFTVSNRVASTTKVSTLVASIKSGTRRMIGAVVSDDGCAPEDPEAAAAYCEAIGLNHIDFHHIEVALERGWITMAQVLAFADRLKAHGIYISVGLADKLGELYNHNGRTGIHAFGQDLCSTRVPAASALYQKNIERLIPLLTHPAVFKVNLVNENAQYTNPADAILFHNLWIPVIRKINPTLQITSLADAWQDPNNPARWDTAVAQLDAQEMNFYGTQEDFNHPSGGPNWILEAWGYRALLWARNRLRAIRPGMPVYIGEYGSYDVNAAQGSNEMFLTVQAAVEKWSTSVFALVTNRAGWKGKSTDKYAVVTSKLRTNMLLFAAYLNKNMTGLKVTFWDYVNYGRRFQAVGDKAEITQDYARVGSNIWFWDKKLPASVLLVKGF